MSSSGQPRHMRVAAARTPAGGSAPALRGVLFCWLLAASFDSAATASSVSIDDDPDLACSAVKAAATAIQAKYLSLHRKAAKAGPLTPEQRVSVAEDAMSIACSKSFEQWAIVGASEDKQRHFSPFQDAMGPGSVSLETMGPEVTEQLRGQCQRLTREHGAVISEGYANSESATGFKLTKTLTDLTGVCSKKKKTKNTSKGKKTTKQKKKRISEEL
jgi:hypothetical protein